MKTVIKSIKSTPLKRYAAFIFCVFLYSSSLFSGLTSSNFSFESSLNFSNTHSFTNRHTSSDLINLESIHGEIPESHNNNFLAFESNENEEEVDTDKLGIVSTRNNLNFVIPISTILNNCSQQLNKRKTIPLFVLHSSWKSFLSI